MSTHRRWNREQFPPILSEVKEHGQANLQFDDKRTAKLFRFAFYNFLKTLEPQDRKYTVLIEDDIVTICKEIEFIIKRKVSEDKISFIGGKAE